MQSAESFLQALDEIVRRNRMLDHPFYQTWNAGTLSREALREYAKQYYRFVHVFPTLLSATHSNTPHLPVRQELLENLLEEERGEQNHPALWMKFVESLGVGMEEAQAAVPLPETNEAINELRSVTRDGSYLEGVSALYAYESQIPQVARVKTEGLKEYYGITDPTALSFFTVHEEADVYHSGGERKILAEYATTDTERLSVLRAAERSSKAMLRLLDGVYRAYVQPSMS